MNTEPPIATPKRKPGRPKGTTKNKPSAVFSVRLHPAQALALRKLARWRKITPRELIISFLEREQIA